MTAFALPVSAKANLRSKSGRSPAVAKIAN